MTFGEAWGWGASKEECRRMFDAYVEAGGNFVDTACNYTDGESEQMVGTLTESDCERFVIATKCRSARDVTTERGREPPQEPRPDSRRASAPALDYVDLLWLHMWDGMTPVEEVVPRSTISSRRGRCCTSASRTRLHGWCRAQ